MTTAPQGQFSVGTVISLAMSVFGANFVPFCVLALILMLPSLVYELLVVADPSAGFSVGSLIALVIQMILGQLTTAAITYGSFQQLRGQPVGIGEALSRGLSLILPVIGVGILAGLATGIGAILLIVPGIIVAVMLWVAIPVAVVERPGVVESLKRSADLTKGHRWQIFGIVLIVGIAAIVAGVILQFVLLSAGGLTIFSIGSWVVNAVFGALFATLAAVGYYLLRVEKEGVDIDQIAKVFD